MVDSAASGPEGAREREDLLQLVYLCPAAIVKLDAYGNIELMNPYGAQLLMPVAIDGALTNLYDLLKPYAPEVGEMALRFTSRSGRVCEEHRIIVPARRAGSEATVLSITLQKIDFDTFVAVMGDVTSAAAREAFVRLSEERMHAVLDGVRDYAICTLDARGVITSWNRAAERLDDYRSDEMIGRHIDAIAPGRAGGPSAMTRRLDIAKRDGSLTFEGWRVRKDGTRYWATSTISLLRDRDHDGLLGYSIITRDMTELRRAEDQLRLLATTDPLTGALNRRSFFNATKRSAPGRPVIEDVMTLLLLDADHFKAVNDTHGHEAGDITLQRIVSDCRKELSSSDILARFGGEEFAIVLPGTDVAGGIAIAERIRERVARMDDADAASMIACTVSIGVAQARAGGEDVEELIRRADAALYEAKHRGRNVVVVAEP